MMSIVADFGSWSFYITVTGEDLAQIADMINHLVSPTVDRNFICY